MAKQLIYDVDARAALKRGVDAVANAVRITLGPKGRNVVLDKKFGSPTITNDGVTIAKEIELEEPFANMGAQLVKEVASKTNDIAGDGTTTATVLAQALIEAGLRQVGTGANPILLKRGIDKGVEAVVEAIKAQSLPVTEREKIAQVASISAADPAVGETVANAMEKFDSIDVLVVGIGSWNPAESCLCSGFPPLWRDEALAAGVQADVCGTLIDRSGHEVASRLDKQGLSITAEQLRHIPEVIGIGGGLQKVDAIAAVLRGGWIDVLVTDAGVVRRLLA